MTDRDIIDRAVEWRKTNRSFDTAPLKFNLTPQELNNALKLPKPVFGHTYPSKVVYRGYQLLAVKG